MAKNTAKKQGQGELDEERKKKGAQKKTEQRFETIPARLCLMKKQAGQEHHVWTATPYGKTHDGRFLCCKECSDGYYSIPNPLGVWGRPESDLIRTKEDFMKAEPPIKEPPRLTVVK